MSHDRAVPEQVPVAEQEVALAERRPVRLEVEMQAIADDDGMRLREQRERDAAATKPRRCELQPAPRQQRDGERRAASVSAQTSPGFLISGQAARSSSATAASRQSRRSRRAARAGAMDEREHATV